MGHQNGLEARPLHCERGLVADNSYWIREPLARRMESQGHTMVVVDDAASALAEIEAGGHSVAIVEPCLPGQNWYQFLNAIRVADPWLRVVVATGHPSTALFAEAVRLNMHCVVKSCSTIDMIVHAACACDAPLMTADMHRLRQIGGCSLSNMEWELINAAVYCCSGNISRAAQALGISRAALYNKLSRHPPSPTTQDPPMTPSETFDEGGGPAALELTLDGWSCRWRLEP